eukprot:197979_1
METCKICFNTQKSKKEDSVRELMTYYDAFKQHISGGKNAHSINDIGKIYIMQMCKNCAFIFLSKYFMQILEIPSICITIPHSYFFTMSNSNITKFICKHTNMWLIPFIDSSIYMSCIAGQIKRLNIKQVSADTIPKQASLLLVNLAMSHFIIQLLARFHWKRIGPRTIFFNSLIDFVEGIESLMAKNRMSCDTIKQCYSIACDFVSIFLHFRKLLEVKCKSNNNYKNKLSQYKLLLTLKYSKEKDMLSRKGYKLLMNKRTMKTYCSRKKCRVTKLNGNTKFVKCCNCLLAVYCSRKCAKKK